MKCPKCGTDFEENNSYCVNCGEAKPLAAMNGEIQAGTAAVISHDVVVDNQYAFRQGEQVVVKSISPNQQRPKYKYVVVSAILQKRFQLSDADLTAVAQPSQQMSAPPVVAYQPPMQQGVFPRQLAVPKERSSDNRKMAIVIISVLVVIGLAVGITVAIVVSGSRGREYTEKATKVLKNLDELDSGLGVGYNIMAYSEKLREVTAAYDSFANWCSEKDKKRESFLSISLALSTYQTAHDEWNSAVSSTYRSVSKTSLQEQWAVASKAIEEAHAKLNQGN